MYIYVYMHTEHTAPVERVSFQRKHEDIDTYKSDYVNYVYIGIDKICRQRE